MLEFCREKEITFIGMGNVGSNEPEGFIHFFDHKISRMMTIKKSSRGKPGVVAQAFNPCTLEEEAGDSLSSRTAGLHRETVWKNQTTTTKSSRGDLTHAKDCVSSQ